MNGRIYVEIFVGIIYTWNLTMVLKYLLVVHILLPKLPSLELS
uniref:Uncharacterized protein n=1 Tax=Dulem virus 42 TaxID=3145760 RepID=A0AAU8B7L7_9CAUD